MIFVLKTELYDLYLQEAAELFLETMWTQVKHIAIKAKKQRIDQECVTEWKRKNKFKLRRKCSGLSLCKLFE